MATNQSEIFIYPEKLLEELKYQIACIEANEPIISRRAKPCVSLCYTFLLKFRDWALNTSFRNHADEAHFFEVHKPKFYRYVTFIAEVYTLDILQYIDKLEIDELLTSAPFSQTTSLLTEREKGIATFVMEGKKHKEIASHLYISEYTVRKHVENIYEKLGVRNKVELINKIGNRREFHQ